jgi:FkbM family methyltransferase
VSGGRGKDRAPEAAEKPASAPALRRRYLTSPRNHALIAHLFKAAFKQHHKEDLPILRRLIPPDGIVFDVGAHAGQYTKLFARLAERGFVFAFEPGSYARTVLRAAIMVNRLNNVAIVPLALGSRAGTATLAMPVKSSGSYGFGLSHLGPADAGREIRAELVGVATLDEATAALGLDRLDFIKADIEGWELQLLRGGRATLARLKPALFLEMNRAQLARAGDDLDAAWMFLSELGYRAHRAGAGGDLTPLDAPSEGDIWWLPPQAAA